MEGLTTWILVLLATAITFAIPKIAQWRRRRSTIRAHGCLPIVKYPHTRPFGWDLDKISAEAMAEGRPNKSGKEQFEICGSNTYERRVFGGSLIFTMEPANAQALHATNFNDWLVDDRRGARYFFGHGLLDSNGGTWKQSRDLVNPLFKRAELDDIDSFKTFVDRFVDQIPRDGSTVDLQPLLRKLFLDSSTYFIFGTSVDSLCDTTGEAQEFLDSFNRAIAGAGQRIMNSGITTGFLLSDKRWKDDCKVVHDFIDDCITRHRATGTENVKRKRYVLLEGMSEQISDPVELRFQLLNIFSPARETAAMAFSNTMFILARNPEVWTVLRTEAATIGDRPLNADLLKSLTLFRNTIYEALRLHGPITKSRRIAARDTILPRGGGPDGSAPTFIKKGTMVYTDNFPVMRDTAIWGDDVEVFRPSRFAGKALNWDFAPFLGGPRICPASQQVVLQSMYLLVRLVQEFDSIENRDPCLEFLETVRMCYECVNGCKIALHPVKTQR